MKIITLNQHALLMRSYRLMRQVDTLPAHPDQTDLITKLGAWHDGLKAHLDKHGLLREPPSADGRVKVVKVKLNDQTLILREDERDMLWDYFEDWSYGGVDITGVAVEFTTMPEADVAALPEFDGF